MEVDIDKVKTFKDVAQFGKWLSRNHAIEQEIWVRVFKKNSGVTSIDWDGCVIEALAWGWIDGSKKTCDESSWYQRLTPRTKKSGWSKKSAPC